MKKSEAEKNFNETAAEHRPWDEQNDERIAEAKTEAAAEKVEELKDPNIRVKPDQPAVDAAAFIARPASGPQFAGVAGLGHGPGSETPHIMEANPLNPEGILRPGEVNRDGPKPDRAVDPRTGEWATAAMQERLKDMTEEDAFGELLSGVYGENTAKNRAGGVIEALRAAGWTVTRP